MTARFLTVFSRHPGLVLLAAFTVALPAQSPAQSPPPEAGVRMRVVTASGVQISGRLVSWRADSLVLDVAGEERVHATHSLVSAETFAGRKGRTWRGAKFGLIIGAVAGLALGIADGDDPPGWFAMSAGEKALGGALGFGVLGMGIGAGVGAASRVDRWQPIAVPGAGSAVAHPGPRIGARIAF